MTAAPETPHWPQLAAAFATLPLPVAIVDLETTGGHFEQDRITEVAVLRFANGQASAHQWLVNPQQPISAFITRLTGINNTMVVAAPTFAQLADELLPLLRGHLLLAHNSRFDYTFLRREFARAGHHFAAPTLCTVQLSRKLYPQHIKHNLDSIIARCGLQLAEHERHRAMVDVMALTAFLNLSLAEAGVQKWLTQCQLLTRPHYLPEWLPENVRQQLYHLPDSPGISLWQQPQHDQTTLLTHERAFSDIGALLQEPGAMARWQHTTKVTFVSAISLLHAHWLKGEHDHNTSQAAKPAACYTVRFEPNHRQQLQARVTTLVNGLQQRPYGLFAHPRAAKRALAEWAREHRLCPAILDIGGQSDGDKVPCPLTAADQCNGGCRDDAQIEAHNAAVLKAAPLLPVLDWGSRHELVLTESDGNGVSITLRCAAGAIELTAEQWYFNDALPRLFRQRLKNPAGVLILY